ncbi:MAG: murein L,D-transpeptidase [Alphaproteobacteria bacterium]
MDLALIRRSLFAACALAVLIGGPVAAQDLPTALKEKTAELIKPGAARDKIREAENQAIQAFYEKREFKSLWFDGDRPNARVKALLETLAGADAHGLLPNDYGGKSLAAKVANHKDDARADLELLLTRTMITYAADLDGGRTTPARVSPDQFVIPQRKPAPMILDGAAQADDLAKYLDGFAPKQPEYHRLKATLVKYRKLAADGGWKPVALGATLKPKMRNARIKQVKERLLVTGELKSLGADPELYDDDLLKAVKAFQDRHGLDADGNIGATTLDRLNVSAAQRVEDIIMNMERRRWLPEDQGRKYIFVNVADFELKIVDGAKTIYTTRVVVGTPYHRTPLFSGTMRYVEFNPWWNVPHSIAVNEMLPTIRKDPGYLARNNYVISTRYGAETSDVDAHAVNWSSLGPGNFPYVLRQKPGPWNALGTVLFMFPNQHNVFLHDTSSKEKFQFPERTFSHGCMRVFKPLDLAILLLKNNKGFERGKLQDILASKVPLRIDLTEPLPVHVTYFTAWTNKDGEVNFRRDVYKRDAALSVALRKAQVQ